MGCAAGRTMLNLDTEDWGEIFIGCAGGGDSELTLTAAVAPAPSYGFAALHLQVAGGLPAHASRLKSGAASVCCSAGDSPIHAAERLVSGLSCMGSPSPADAGRSRADTAGPACKFRQSLLSASGSGASACMHWCLREQTLLVSSAVADKLVHWSLQSMQAEGTLPADA